MLKVAVLGLDIGSTETKIGRNRLVKASNRCPTWFDLVYGITRIKIGVKAARSLGCL